jgi:hypothetical protein
MALEGTHTFLSSPSTHYLLLIHPKPCSCSPWPCISTIFFRALWAFTLSMESNGSSDTLLIFYQITRRHISIDSNSHSHSIQNLRSHRDKWFVYQMNKYQMAITNTVFWNPFISEQWWSSKNSLHIFTSWSSAEFEKLGFVTVFSDCRCVFILGNLP